MDIETMAPVNSDDIVIGDVISEATESSLENHQHEQAPDTDNECNKDVEGNLQPNKIEQEQTIDSENEQINETSEEREESSRNVEEDNKDCDMYHGHSGSVVENVESMTLIDNDLTVQLESPPTSITQSPQPSSSIKKSSSEKKGKRKSNDFKPTVVKPFSFTTEKRLEDRHKYNERIHKMQKAQEERERLENERKEKEEEEEMKLMRKKTIPKAKPIRYYKPITITPSKKALTMPEAPNLCLENRNRKPKVGDKNERPQGSNNKLKQVS